MTPELRDRIRRTYEQTWCEVSGVAANPSQIAAEAVYHMAIQDVLAMTFGYFRAGSDDPVKIVTERQIIRFVDGDS